jgi:hypothetical protein
VYQRNRDRGKAYKQIAGGCLEGYLRSAPDTEREDDSQEEGWRKEIGEAMKRKWAEQHTRKRKGRRTSSYFWGGRTIRQRNLS